MCNEMCGDNRFEIIAEAKRQLLEYTNIETSPDEMAVIDSFLFRCWQMGWLKSLDKGAPCRMSLNRIGVVNQIFSVPTEKGKKVLTDAIFLPNKEAEDKGNRLSGWNCQSNPQEQCPVIPAGL